ncbi:Hypothetical predicted protein [Octopus vulgaris]|uniref:Uncharacterized protein n=1 Tax=Octopus vulgaris TaxID=6645 RepID=A0AA36F916_OCTVU|nr:Hypothetical predicted protein [Octopus vulgaris]
MGSTDYKESKRQISTEKRKGIVREKEEKKSMESEVTQREEQHCHDVYQLFDSSSEENDVTSDENSKESSEAIPNRGKYNRRNFALASIRHHTGLRQAAEIANAHWIDASLISQVDSSLVIDHNKLGMKIMSEISDQQEKELKGGLSCLLFDGRIDEAKVTVEIDGISKTFPGLNREEHYTICSELGGQFLFHFTLEVDVEGTSYSEVIVDNILCWLQERGLENSVQDIGGDSIAVNIG